MKSFEEIYVNITQFIVVGLSNDTFSFKEVFDKYPRYIKAVDQEIAKQVENLTNEDKINAKKYVVEKLTETFYI